MYTLVSKCVRQNHAGNLHVPEQVLALINTLYACVADEKSPEYAPEIIKFSLHCIQHLKLKHFNETH